MAKTPVSTLQELSAKRMWGVPVYELISCHSVGKFTYRVSCNSMTACGTALNKKEAKHSAAENMLVLLRKKSHPNYQSFAISNGTTENSMPDYSSAANQVSSKETFVNSVGKLNEFCAGQKLKAPEYRDLEKTGPAHAPIFTVICNIGKLKVSAAANTKKKAKQDAAEMMLDQLVRNVDYKKSDDVRTNGWREIDEEIRKTIDTLDLQIDNLSIGNEESAQRAKELFPLLNTYKNKKKTCSNQHPDQYHRSFRDTYGEVICDVVCTRLRENSQSGSSRQDVLDNIAGFLRVDVNYNLVSKEATNLPTMMVGHRELETCLKDQNQIIVIVTFGTSPVITDAGVGNTYPEAREHAILNLLNSIDVFFS